MKNILFICALAEERQALVDNLAVDAEKLLLSSSLGLSVLKYQRGPLSIFVTESGMGNVNAGVKLALILEQHPIDQIILLGVGGALHLSLNIGDMIISDKVIQHDYFSSLESGSYLMQPGELILNETQGKAHNPIIHSNISSFSTKAIEGAKRHPNIKVKQGLIASGSEFVGTAERKNTIHQQCQQAMLVDMEASAVAFVANQYNCPFIVAKTISDRLHSDGSISTDFSTFLSIASSNAAAIAMLIINSVDD